MALWRRQRAAWCLRYERSEMLIKALWVCKHKIWIRTHLKSIPFRKHLGKIVVPCARKSLNSAPMLQEVASLWRRLRPSYLALRASYVEERRSNALITATTILTDVTTMATFTLVVQIKRSTHFKMTKKTPISKPWVKRTVSSLKSREVVFLKKRILSL